MVADASSSHAIQYAGHRGLCFPWKSTISSTCTVSDLLDDGKCEYILIYLQMKSVQLGLKITCFSIPSCPEAAVWVPAPAEPLPDDTPGPAAQGGGGPGRPQHCQLQGQGQKGRCCIQGTTVTQRGMIQYKMLSPQVLEIGLWKCDR